MISRLSPGIFGFGMCGLCACTLTEPAYQPLHVDSAGGSSAGAATAAGNDAAAATSLDPSLMPSAAPTPSNDGSGAHSPVQESMSASPPLVQTEPTPARSTETDAGLVEEPGSSTGSSSGSSSANDAGVPPTGDAGSPELPPAGLIGWASVAGLGTPTTTGGAAGTVVVASTAQELADLAAHPEPLTIEITGTFRVPRLNVASNKTLRGVGAARLEGGLRIRGSAGAFIENVIIENLDVDASFSDVDGDGIQIHSAHHVWVDHCSVHDALDGNADIVHGSDFVTLSWNRFSFAASSTNTERRSSLIGHSATNAAEDAGHLRVTLHHNFWQPGIKAAMPSVRFGDVHVFDNYYASSGADSAITADFASRILVENNFFDGIAAPLRIIAGSTPASEARAVGNAFAGTVSPLETAGNAFIPPYPYSLDAAQDIPTLVSSGAGPSQTIDTR
jgi:pectate lyase